MKKNNRINVSVFTDVLYTTDGEEIMVTEYNFDAGMYNITLITEWPDEEIMHIIAAAQVAEMDIDEIIAYAEEVYDKYGIKFGYRKIMF
jgi:hypothetical protein